MRFFNQVPESFEDNLAHIDDLGGPSSYNHYAWGWAWAGDTPFRRWKRETYRGGSTDPFVLAWPAGMSARGEIRTQYAHAIDMVPTVVDHEYEIERDGEKVAEISKRWLRVRDAYGIEIAPDQDDALILAVAVCIDRMGRG
jgi:arylsulfatase A-like enzyme